MRASVVALAGLLLLPALHPGAAEEAPPQAQPWMAKADAPLQASIASDPSTQVSVVVAGQPLPAPFAEPPTRAAWRAHWARASEAFLEELRERVTALGGEVERTLPAVNAAHVRLAAGRVPDLLRWPETTLAGLDAPGAVRLAQGPGPNPEGSLTEGLALVQADQLWALGLRGEGIRVAVIDTGVRATHDMFLRADGTTRVAFWADVTAEPGNVSFCDSPCDTYGHGTHVASILAGSNLYNASAPEGAAPGATLLAVRVFQGGEGTWSSVQAGLQTAFDAGADIASNSWGGECDGEGAVTTYLVENLTRAGMVSVFAAGNEPALGVLCPGRSPLAVTVGATNANKIVASFSAGGPCAWPEGSVPRTCPDVMAVGVGVRAAWRTCDTCYANLSGTSMATPQVAGVLALLEQASRASGAAGLDTAAGEEDMLLRYSAQDRGRIGPDNTYGWGFAQAKAAHELLDDPVRVVDGFSTGLPVLRGLQNTTLEFSVANLGSVPVTGRLTHRAEQVDTGLCPPACEAITVADETLDLPAVAERASAYHFFAAEHRAGTWRVTASYAYSYTDPGDGLVKHGLVERSGTFEVRKVDFLKVRAGPALAHPGELIAGGLLLHNVGNEDASLVAFTERFVPIGFAPVPQVPPAPGDYGLFAAPAPGNVRLLTGPLRLEYQWEIGTVAEGTLWAARYDLLAALPGSYQFQGTLTYRDGVGQAFVESLNETRTVG